MQKADQRRIYVEADARIYLDAAGVEKAWAGRQTVRAGEPEGACGQAVVIFGAGRKVEINLIAPTRIEMTPMARFKRPHLRHCTPPGVIISPPTRRGQAECRNAGTARSRSSCRPGAEK
jgi:hypothetical protein